MSYLVTSLGRYPEAYWECLDCPAKGAARLGADLWDGGEARTGAAAHVTWTGHSATVSRGSRELLTSVSYERPQETTPLALPSGAGNEREGNHG